MTLSGSFSYSQPPTALNTPSPATIDKIDAVPDVSDQSFDQKYSVDDNRSDVISLADVSPANDAESPLNILFALSRDVHIMLLSSPTNPKMSSGLVADVYKGTPGSGYIQKLVDRYM